MIKHLINRVKAAARDLGKPKRDPKWPRVAKGFLKSNPMCASCGSEKKLNVHHKKPFHLHPEDELNVDNLITLCMDNDCHLLVGHGDSFKAYNPNVVDDAKKVIDAAPDVRTNTLKEVAQEAKTNRLFE